GGIDDGGIAAGDRLVADSEAVGHAGQKILDHHVGAPGELESHPGAVRVLEVERQRALVSIHRREDRAHPVLATPVAKVVAAAGTLDLDDVGAEIAEQERTIRPGHDAREIEDAQSGEDHSRSRNPSVIALTSGIPVRAIALMRALTSATARNGLAASRSAKARTSLTSASLATTRWTRPSPCASSPE